MEKIKTYDTVLPVVELTSRWYEILGNKREKMPDKLRRERWEQWKQLAIEDGGQDSVDYWMDTTACENCKHIDKDWCKLMELPCTTNPLLTFSQGMIGVACGGAGKDVEPTQLALW